MMVAACIGLLVVMISVPLLGALAIVLVRESRKLDSAGELVKKYATAVADLSRLEKGLNGLEELVAVKLNRIATTDKRNAKRARTETIEEEEQPELPKGLFFPSRKA